MKFKPTVGIVFFTYLVPVLTLAEDRIEEVVVVSSLTEMPIRQVATSVTVIDEDELTLRGYNSLTEILRTQPGIAVSEQGGKGKVTALRIRGEEAFRTRILIDGIEISDTTSPQVAPQPQHLLTGNSLQRVEILRGPQGFAYGADAGGVINIITRSGGDRAEGRISVETSGSNNTQSFSGAFGSGLEMGDVYIALDDYQTDGFNARSDDLSEDDDGYENTTAHFKLGLQRNNVRGQLVLRDVDAFNEYDNCFAADFSPTNDCENIFKQTQGRLTLELETALIDSRVGYTQSTTDNEFYGAKAFSYGNHGKLTTLDYLGQIAIAADKSLVVGAQRRTEALDSGDEELSSDQDGGFFEWQSQHFERLFFTAGARHDDNEDFGQHTSVRSSLAYLIPVAEGREIKLRSTYGTGFRAPSLYEVSYNNTFGFGQASEIALKEENSRGLDIGIDYYFQQSQLSLTLFEQDIDNQIYFDSVDFSGYLQTETESISKGVELAYTLALAEHWVLDGNLTYNDTEARDNSQRIRRPEWLSNIGVRFNLLEDTLKLLANLRSSRDSIDSDNQALDDYDVLDLSVNLKLGMASQFSIRFENIADANYQEVTNFNTAGRTAYAGISFQF